MPDAILHVGLHKTGTTAIQLFAATNRALLARAGLFYPDYQPVSGQYVEGHHQFAHAFAEKSKTLTGAECKRLVRHWEEVCADRVLFLSAEPFWRHFIGNIKENDWLTMRRKYLSEVSKAFSAFRCKVVIVLRRQDDYILSLYKEHIKNNSKGGRVYFESFIESKKDKSLRFLDSIDLFRDLFSSVQLLTFENLKSNNDLVSDFFCSIGYPLEQHLSPGVVRKSDNYKKSLVKLHINRLLGPNAKDKNKIVDKWLRDPEIAQLIDKEIPGNKQDFWGDISRRRAFLETFDEENETIRQRFFSNERSLFPPLIGENGGGEIATISPQLQMIIEKFIKRLRV